MSGETRNTPQTGSRLIHQSNSNGEKTTIATNIEVADTFIQRARGLMFRRSINDDTALVFHFDGVSQRGVHMMFVAFPIDVLWITGNEVTATKTLQPWVGFCRANADMLVELPVGTAGSISSGDRIQLID